jgi:hypothetical protein
VKIEFTGLRAGEKLYEELLASDETTRPTHHPKVRIARARAMDDTLWLGRLERWLSGRCRPEPAACARTGAVGARIQAAARHAAGHAARGGERPPAGVRTGTGPA